MCYANPIPISSNSFILLPRHCAKVRKHSQPRCLFYYFNSTNYIFALMQVFAGLNGCLDTVFKNILFWLESIMGHNYDPNISLGEYLGFCLVFFKNILWTWGNHLLDNSGLFSNWNKNGKNWFCRAHHWLTV